MLLRSSEIKPLFSSRDLISFLKENLFFLFLLNLYLRLFITDSAFPLSSFFLLEGVILLFIPRQGSIEQHGVSNTHTEPADFYSERWLDFYCLNRSQKSESNESTYFVFGHTQVKAPDPI